MEERKSKGMKLRFFTPILVLVCIVLVCTFYYAYWKSKTEIIDLGGTMFKNINSNMIGFMEAMNEEVKAGNLTLEQAQETVKTYVLGPMRENGVRDIAGSRMSMNSKTFAWAVKTQGDERGVLAMHPSLEGKNAWNVQTQGKYTIQDTWANRQIADRIVEDVWQNPGKPVETFLAYQSYFGPWDWMVGIGGSKEDLYTERLEEIEVMFIAIGILFVIGGGLFVIYVNRLRGTLGRSIRMLTESAEQIIGGAQEVAAASQSLAEDASEQAGAIQQTSSSLEEMSSMTRQNADNAKQANHLMKAGKTSIQSANDSMNQLTASMDDIVKSSEETFKIIKTIDEIAFQTNLLALNAAVEAARAGEAGAGFAVVADEVRNLAMRAGDAARNTAGLIEITVKKIKDGGELVGQTNSVFAEVTQSSDKISDLIGEIAAASDEQAQGIEQVNTSVAEMDKVTQKNAANAQQSASASQQMRGQAEKMKDFVEDLTHLVGKKEQKRTPMPERSRPQRAQKRSSKSKPAPPPYKPREQKAEKRAPAPARREVSPNEIIPLDDDDFKDF